MGCEARKIPADAEVFFLDSYLYRTYQALAVVKEVTGCGERNSKSNVNCSMDW
jgi:hypothetical protein